MLDEPAATQTDPTVLEIMLKQVSKTSSMIAVPVAVRSIENAEKNPQKITTWVKKIDEVHRGKPLPSVHYSKPMPDIERLMQVWPSQFEELLKTVFATFCLCFCFFEYLFKSVLIMFIVFFCFS